eukprot:gene1759-3885_t
MPYSGQVSPDEQAMLRKLARAVKAFDRDGSHTLDAAELRAGIDALQLDTGMLESLAANHDGVIALNEWFDEVPHAIRVT